MINKTKLALGIAAATFTMTGALVSPQAVAGTKAQHHAEVAGVSSKVDALEAQLQAMQAEISRLRSEASRPRASAESSKVQELDQWMASVKSAPKESKKQDNLIFFRGGYARNDVKRNDLLTGNQFAGNALGGGQSNKDGWYIGAGFDFGLTDNVWGLMDDTDVMAELMFDYRSFGSKQYNNIATSRALQGGATTTTSNNSLCTLINLAANGGTGGASTGAAGTNACNSVNVSQFTLGASPKIKFMKGSAFRPWIIPFGLTVNVISPPSNGVTVLNPGMQFGTGAEYAIWKAIKVGADVRYNLTGRSVDGVNTDGMTAGGYLGIGF